MLDLPGPFLDKINPHLPRVHTSRAGRETLAPDASAVDVQRYLSSRINSQVTLGSKGLIRSNWGGNCPGDCDGKTAGRTPEVEIFCGSRRFSVCSCYGWATDNSGVGARSCSCTWSPAQAAGALHKHLQEILGEKLVSLISTLHCFGIIKN